MWKRGKMTNTSENGDSDKKLGVTELEPLYPRYIEGEHRVYVDAIESAIDNDHEGKLHNIALSGVYGSGKSSILEKVVRILRTENGLGTWRNAVAEIPAVVRRAYLLLRWRPVSMMACMTADNSTEIALKALQRITTIR
jgi:hypothetical protein